MNLSGDELWRWLRGTRWKPPKAATADQERCETYVFALEQAEQMFRAAATVGPATQPLLIFYGLSQAGRAIMATAPVKGDQWRLVGHGISQDPKTFAGPLADVAVTTSKAGNRSSFVRLSQALDSPVWEDSAVPLGALWDCLPENRFSSLATVTNDRRTPLDVDERTLPGGDPNPHASVEVWDFPPWVASAGNADALKTYMKAFPGSEGFAYPWDGPSEAQEPAFSLDLDGWGGLTMHWHVPPGSNGSYEDRRTLIRAMTRPHGRARYLVPAVGSNTKSLHPLMTWWAVLHTLSMLARYEPAQWSKHIHIDSSQQAVPLESLLEKAISTLPTLIAYVLDELSGGELTSR
ncbi:YaaC family protein [Streptomyces sp. NBC_01485]|uniref:YaaC family protein n=1 Tax=Streptomyces sp. NBC_01485 TaxID=2903884 RepID=UPI002E2EC6DE|nr:YaaC family protein [Streptomyces sp. NBC_01485]